MASINKAEIKIGAVIEVGNKLDDALEAYQREHHELNGAHAICAQINKSIMTLTGLVDKQIEDGKLDLESGKFVKGVILKACAICDDTAKRVGDKSQQTKGKIFAMARAVEESKRIVDTEKRKIELELRLLEEEKIKKPRKRRTTKKKAV